MNVARIRNHFPLLIKHKNLVYLDSAATSQKPREVIRAEAEWYEKRNANIHRGAYDLAEQATRTIEQVRADVADFIHAPSAQNIVFTKGATEAINLVAFAWARNMLKRGDAIVLTDMEHHANLVPWLMLAKEKKLQIRFVPLGKNGTLDMPALTRILRGAKLLAVTHASNVLGTVNPIARIARLAHRAGASVLVDAAQSVPHMPLDVQKLGADFFVFSGHKMYGPTGVGVLYVREERYSEMSVYQTGGDMVRAVSKKSVLFQEAPWKFEAGTLPLAQIVGLGAAISFLQKLGMKRVQTHGVALARYAYQKLSRIPEITLYGPASSQRVPLISFTVRDIHPHDLATFLNTFHVAIRAGHHCAEPLHKTLCIPATARMSFGVYTTKQDIDHAIAALITIIREWRTSTTKK